MIKAPQQEIKDSSNVSTPQNENDAKRDDFISKIEDKEHPYTLEQLLSAAQTSSKEELLLLARSTFYHSFMADADFDKAADVYSAIAHNENADTAVFCALTQQSYTNTVTLEHMMNKIMAEPNKLIMAEQSSDSKEDSEEYYQEYKEHKDTIDTLIGIAKHTNANETLLTKSISIAAKLDPHDALSVLSAVAGNKSASSKLLHDLANIAAKNSHVLTTIMKNGNTDQDTFTLVVKKLIEFAKNPNETTMMKMAGLDANFARNRINNALIFNFMSLTTQEKITPALAKIIIDGVLGSYSEQEAEQRAAMAKSIQDIIKLHTKKLVDTPELAEFFTESKEQQATLK